MFTKYINIDIINERNIMLQLSIKLISMRYKTEVNYIKMHKNVTKYIKSRLKDKKTQ